MSDEAKTETTTAPKETFESELAALNATKEKGDISTEDFETTLELLREKYQVANETTPAATESDTVEPAATDAAEPPKTETSETVDAAPAEEAATAETEPEAVVELSAEDVEKRLAIQTVMVQTGGSKAGAKTLVGNMNEGEVNSLVATLDTEKGVKIKDSAGYREALGKVSKRLEDEQKASVDAAKRLKDEQKAAVEDAE